MSKERLKEIINNALYLHDYDNQNKDVTIEAIVNHPEVDAMFNKPALKSSEGVR